MDTIKNRLSEIDRHYINSLYILKMLLKTCLLAVGDICIAVISCFTSLSNKMECLLKNNRNGNVHIFSIVYIFLWYRYTVFSCSQDLTTSVLSTENSCLQLS